MSKKKVSAADATAEVATPPAPFPPAVEGRPVIICTAEKAVLFGWATDTSNSTVHLKRARMAIRWGTTRGVLELAEVGPNSNSSKISARADGEFRNVIAVFEVTEEAARKWEEIV